MPELRSQTRRNREKNNNPNQNPNPIKLTVQTRRRRTAEKEKKNNAIAVDDKKNIVRLLEETPIKPEEARVLREAGAEDVAAKMDEYDSGGGRSADKGPGAEDEGSTAPLPEKVGFYFWEMVRKSVGK